MRTVSIMIKPASSLCNLQCKYCFYLDLAQHRQQQSYGIMDDNTTYNIIKNALDFVDGGEVYFTFQGGEPLIAKLQYFKNFLEITKQLNKKCAKINFALQTNATLIDESFAKFFAQNNFLIGVSLDGDKVAQKHRTDIHGNSSFEKVMQGIEYLKKYNINFNILTVITSHTAKNIKQIYNFFALQNFKFVQFIPCLRAIGSQQENNMYMTPEQYGDFLIKIFDLYLQDYKKGNYTSIRFLDNWVNLYLGNKPEQCGVEGHCSGQFVVEGNGNVYPCDFYCLDQWLLGNINEMDFRSMSQSEKAKNFVLESFNLDEKCRDCKFLFLCHGGGCKRTRTDRDYCLSYRKFFIRRLSKFDEFRKKSK